MAGRVYLWRLPLDQRDYAKYHWPGQATHVSALVSLCEIGEAICDADGTLGHDDLNCAMQHIVDYLLPE
jgi:hypothetical protein